MHRHPNKLMIITKSYEWNLLHWWNIRRALQRYLYTHLVYGHPGDEPRSLKDKDGGDGDGARDAKRLEAG